MSIRVRYAPSPTGLQHIGGLRTALFNYFYAKSRGGRCILRIEDTDQSRFDPAALDDLYEVFQWMGIGFDEGPQAGGNYGPYIQSERAGIYRDHARRLLAEGHAYKCFCSPERLEGLRQSQNQNQSRSQGQNQNQKQKQKQPRGYDRRCRNLDGEEVARREAAGEAFVIRFKVPLEGESIVEDGILGNTRRRHRDISPDPVLLKSDGLATYHLASVVDDHLMEISHVIRAQEWLSSAALHQLLYEAFGWRPPNFLHLPMVLGKDGKKLSKRDGSTSIADFRKEGYLAEALLNHVITLGWSLGDREFFSCEELEQLFSEGYLNKASALFDHKKLQWYNAHYIKERSDEELIELCRPYLVERGLFEVPPAAAHAETGDRANEKLLREVMPLAKERMRRLSDISDLAGFLFVDEVDLGQLLQKNQDAQETLEVLRAVHADFDAIATLAADAFHAWFEKLAEDRDCKLGRVMMPLRMALTGSKASPPLHDCIRLLGKRRALRRLEAAIELLEGVVSRIP